MIYLKVRNKKTGVVRDITQKSLSLLGKKERANYEVITVDATMPEKKPLPQEPVVAVGVAVLAEDDEEVITQKAKPGPKPGKGKKSISASDKGAEV